MQLLTQLFHWRASQDPPLMEQAFFLSAVKVEELRSEQ